MKKQRYAKRVEAPFPDRAKAPLPGAHPWLVYVLTDENRARFSISMAKDVDARVYRHRDPIGNVLRQRTPILVRVERYADRYTAVARMQRLRRWAHPALIGLIESENSQWKDLYVPPPGLEA